MNLGIYDEDVELFNSFGYDVKKLSNPYTIKLGKETCALIGLTNLLWSNRRAELVMYLSKDLEFDVLKYLMPAALDKYSSFMCDCGLENIIINVNSEDKFTLYLLANTHMNYIGMIPYYFENESSVCSSYIFEYYPGIIKKDNITVTSKLSVKEGSMKLGLLDDVINEKIKVTIKDEKGNIVEDLKIAKEQLPEMLPIDDVLFDDGKIKAVSSQYLVGKLKSITEIVGGYIDALTYRDEFSIPLGEDKYIIQEGNGNYGASKQLLNFDYILLDEGDNFIGYCNRLSSKGRNARIDIGIHPKYQNNGYGSKLLSCYYNELFRMGYLSVTSYVFEFNESSIKLHNKYASLIGTRKNSYFAKGRLWNMNIYVKTK